MPLAFGLTDRAGPDRGTCPRRAARLRVRLDPRLGCWQRSEPEDRIAELVRRGHARRGRRDRREGSRAGNRPACRPVSDRRATAFTW